MKRVVAFIISLCFLFAVGCGYHFQGVASNPPGGIKSVAVPKVVNVTTYVDLATDLTNNLIQQFNLSKVLDVKSEDKAEAVLQTEIISVQVESAARSTTEDASASRKVTVRVKATLKKKLDGRILWQNPGLTSRKTYTVSDDQSIVDANLNNALVEVAADVAQKIHDNIFEDF